MVYRCAMPDPARYSITELADLAGVTPRTVRYYLAQGLIPSPGATGPGVKYGDEVLDRLRLIRRLQRKHLPLAEIRQRLAGLTDFRIALLADEDLIPDDFGSTMTRPDTALDYIRRILAPTAAVASPTEAAPAAPAAGGLLRHTVAAEAPGAYSAPSPRPSPAFSMAPAAVEPDVGPDAIERSQWDRISLAPDIELHVRRPLARSLSRKVDRLVTIARELLEEDPS
jgi:DNA-binding transcriptional MerR regulator